MRQNFILIALVIVLALSGCSMPGAASPTATVDGNAVITAAAATAFVELTRIAGLPTETPPASPTSTPEPFTATPSPTIEVQLVPVDAICTYVTVVRSWPGKGGENLGFVRFESGVKVLARNFTGGWLYIEWPDSPTGRAWVIADGFTLKSDIGRLPIALEEGDKIVFQPPIIWEISGAPMPLPTVSNDPSLRPATVVSGASIRVCPAKGCMIIGQLYTGDQIIMTGRFGENQWAQFMYPSGPDGKGWVIRTAIQPGSESFGGLPYFDVFGKLVTPEPPTGTPDPNQSPTPTITVTTKPVGQLAEITIPTTVYTLMSSLSPELEVLNPKTKIYITAISINKLWYEINYPKSPTGRAYISSKEIKLLGDFRYMPWMDSLGTPIP